MCLPLYITIHPINTSANRGLCVVWLRISDMSRVVCGTCRVCVLTALYSVSYNMWDLSVVCETCRVCVLTALYYSVRHTSSGANRSKVGVVCVWFFAYHDPCCMRHPAGCVCLLIYITTYTTQALVTSKVWVVCVWLSSDTIRAVCDTLQGVWIYWFIS